MSSVTVTAAHPAPPRRTRLRDVHDGLTGAVFPPVDPLGRRARAGTALFALLAFAVAYLRLPPGAAGSIWAEDGTRFLTGELVLGFPATVTEPYAGYMHLLPRLAGFVAGSLPLAWANDVFALGASAVVALCATATLVLARGHLPSLGVRLLLAAMVVLLPSGGLEAAGNTANSHWFLMAACYWALTSRPTGRGATALAAVVAVLAVGSDPLTVLLAPLLLVRVLLLRGRRDHVVTAAFAVTALVQGLVVLGTERTDGAPPPSLAQTTSAYAARIPFVLLTGLYRSTTLFERYGWLAVTAAVAVFVVAAGLAVAVAGRLRWVAVTAGVASVVFFVAPATVSWSPRFDPDAYGLDAYTVSRYSVVPMLLLMAVAAAGLQAVRERAPRWVFGVLLVGALLVAATTVPQALRPDPPVRPGPLWDAGVSAATQACQQDRSLVSARVPLSPEAPQWVVDLPCARLR